MSYKSLIYTANTTPLTVAVGGSVPVGSIIRRYGNGLFANGYAINITETGYYLVDFNALFGGTAGDVKFNVLVNGLPIQGATAETTIATADTQIRSVAINTVVRVNCCAGANVSVVIDAESTSTPTIQSAAFRVVKV